MQTQYEEKDICLVVGRDYRLHGKVYEYVISALDGEVLLDRKGFFRSLAAAKKAGIAAAQSFIAPALF
jgi:hypothetical protein